LEIIGRGRFRNHSNFSERQGFKPMYGFSGKNYGKSLKFGREIACNKSGCR